MGLNFQYYDGLEPKIGAGIINEHECTLDEFRKIRMIFDTENSL